MGEQGNGGSGHGGAIFVANGGMALVNCTIADNSATAGAGKTNGLGIGGGIYSYRTTGSSSVTLLNTLIANNSATTSSPDALGTNFSSAGFNLVGNNQGAVGLSINDYQNVLAGLGPFQDNGGNTRTQALLPGSLAIGGGSSVGAPATDQRGVVRPPSQVDIGAFQFSTAPAVNITTQPLGQTIAPGGGVTLNVAASGTGLSYQWQFNGTNIPSATSPTLNLANLAATNAGAYRVVVSSSAGGSTTSQNANLLFFGELKLYSGTTLGGPVGQQFRLDYADVVNIGTTNWLLLTNVTLPFSPYLVIDPNSPGQTKRFYRAVPLPSAGSCYSSTLCDSETIALDAREPYRGAGERVHDAGSGQRVSRWAGHGDPGRRSVLRSHLKTYEALDSTNRLEGSPLETITAMAVSGG